MHPDKLAARLFFAPDALGDFLRADSPSPPAHVLTDEERKRIMDDKKLNDFMGVFKGAQITSLK